jgi:hypothetical protein
MLFSQSPPVRLAALVFASMMALHGGAALAESSGPADGTGRWSGLAVGYLWMANITGSQTVKDTETDLDVGFGDVLDVLDFAAQGRVEAIKDNRWGFFIDGTYLKLGPEVKQGPVHLRVGYKYWLWELGGLYRAATWATKHGHGAFDLLLGGRYTSMDVDLDFRNLPLPDVSGSRDWTDLIAGARVAIDLPHDWSVSLRGDLGGFGIGGSSNLSAQSILAARWRFAPAWEAVIGYRALYQDYENGHGATKFAYDATTHGPVLGVSYRF